jgi:predicted lysophospholipase L1 biosynthesis ABC-type transport system permease subunit
VVEAGKGRRYRVVGVTASAARLFGPSGGSICFSRDARAVRGSSLVVRFRPGRAEAGLLELHARLKSLAPGHHVRVTERHALPRLQNAGLLLALLLLVGMGALTLGGAWWLEIAGRTSELGLRRALGARAWQVRLQIVTEVALHATWASVLGAVVVLHVAWGNALLSRRAGPSSAFYWMLPLAHLGLLAVVLIASWLPARRAARIQPIEALRHD